jgi:A118 family predicted phage portal protein
MFQGFQKILQWIKEWINKMINQSSVKSALNFDVAISPLMSEALQKWTLMYSNQSTWLNDETKSLQLPAAIASEISRAVTIELDFEITGSPRADYLYEQVENALKDIRQKVEFGCAKGGLIMKPYVKGDKVIVDFVQADQFYPISFDENGMTACVFSDTKTIGDKYYTRLEYHSLTDAGYRIVNTAFIATSPNTLGNQCALSIVPEWADLQPDAMITGIERPLFSYFKYPLANSVDPTSPLGVSCYARAEELIEQADGQWEKLMWEFESGKRALYADPGAFDIDSTTKKPFLPIKRLYRTLHSSGNVGDGNKLFEEWTPTLREASILAGLDAILKRIEFTCGLAQGTISDPNTVALTATEIKASKQRTYATITDTQNALEDAFEHLLWAMDTWATIYNLAPEGNYDAVWYFDDSVVSDHDVLLANSMLEVSANLMSKIEYRMVVKGETEEVARKYLAMVAEEQQANSFFNPPPPPGDNQGNQGAMNGQDMNNQNMSNNQMMNAQGANA